METWAHGQDVADALGAERPLTDRLRHVAHIGIRALPYSYLVHGLPVPTEPIRVELTAPDGQTWSWGPADAADRVTGPALDFCLAVTQRRHRSDTSPRRDRTGGHPVDDDRAGVRRPGRPGPPTRRQNCGRKELT